MKPVHGGTKMGHQQGQSRHQATLFPEALDELIPSDHPVRVVDASVNSLDLGALGFNKVQTATTGRPPYHPGDLLKLYVYGYLNQVQNGERGAACEAAGITAVVPKLRSVNPRGNFFDKSQFEYGPDGQSR